MRHIWCAFNLGAFALSCFGVLCRRKHLRAIDARRTILPVITFRPGEEMAELLIKLRQVFWIGMAVLYKLIS